MSPRFFITHSHQDNVFVARLAADLRRVGFDGFLDIYSLKPGDLISREISRGLEACDFYLPVLSHAALDSPWCELEIHTAITLSNEPGRGGRPHIIPLLVEECQARLDPFLRARLYLRFHENYEAAFLILLRALGVGGAIGGIDPSAPIATPPEPGPRAVIATPRAKPPEPKIEPQPTPPASTKSETATRKVKSQPKSPAPRMITPPQPKIELPARRTNGAGQEMILIPAGEFLMGSSDKQASRDQKPQHPVYLDAFYISRYPVTNAEYKKFIDATKRGVPKHWKTGNIPKGKDNHPVVNVNWADASAYCQWVGGRLPTEAEWEKAASWDETNKTKRKYPWGNTFDKNRCNTGSSGIHHATRVGRYSPQGDSFYGVGDMAGNVWEWCADWYAEGYYKSSPRENPQGPDSGERRVSRGGSWFFEASNARGANRGWGDPGGRDGNIGFRVASSP